MGGWGLLCKNKPKEGDANDIPFDVLSCADRAAQNGISTLKDTFTVLDNDREQLVPWLEQEMSAFTSFYTPRVNMTIDIVSWGKQLGRDIDDAEIAKAIRDA